MQEGGKEVKIGRPNFNENTKFSFKISSTMYNTGGDLLNLASTCHLSYTNCIDLLKHKKNQLDMKILKQQQTNQLVNISTKILMVNNLIYYADNISQVKNESKV